MKPLVIDLFCGLGGWADGFIAEGYDVVGFDIERHDYGTGGYPGQLVIQDVRTLHGSQFKDVAVIVASPPCQKYSYMAMPWSRGKKMAEEIRNDYFKYSDLNYLFVECFRLQREASEAAGRYIPLIVENVRGAQAWVGQSRWHYGSFHLWGDIPALMPIVASVKKPGQDWNRFAETGQTSPHWTMVNVDKIFALSKQGGGMLARAESATQSALLLSQLGLGGQGPGVDHNKTRCHVNKRDGHTHARHLTAQFESDEVREGRKGAGAVWFDQNLCTLSSKSRSRKAASAQIAKIPLPLARHIAQVYKP